MRYKMHDYVYIKDYGVGKVVGVGFLLGCSSITVKIYNSSGFQTFLTRDTRIKLIGLNKRIVL